MKKNDQNYLKISTIYFHNFDLNSATKQIIKWIKEDQTKFISLCNTHSLSICLRKKSFLKLLNSSDINLPDGMPIALYLSIKYFRLQKRVSGPDLMMKILKDLPNKKTPIYFLGSTLDILRILKNKFSNDYGFNNIYIESPPFRKLSKKENNDIINRINKSKSKIIFVSLGCPKQEEWIYENKRHLNGILIGVGAAFSFHANKLQRAPKFIQIIGFEWLFRLFQEPKRLFFRYIMSGLALFTFVLNDSYLNLKRCIKKIYS